MSRIGKKPVSVPGGVSVAVGGDTVSVSGPLGSLEMRTRPEVRVRYDESSREVTCSIEESAMGDRRVRAFWGLTRALISNMVTGVQKGFEKRLEVVGVGYQPSMAGSRLRLAVGFADPVLLEIPEGVFVEVDRQFVTVKGTDAQKVGSFAARIRAVRPPEPYNGKGIKYVDEVVRRKVGKQFGA